MGACFCKGHRELHHVMTSLQDQTVDDQTASGKDVQTPSNGSVADKTSGYNIGELATSSLIGLVATIKDHITKPTAMAQGRVAHLIEWKGWGGGGGGAEACGGGGASWGGIGAELQQDEHFYSQMTDEIKEARFAAGVAEQFALAEAAMSVWSMNDGLERQNAGLEAPQNHLLSHFLLDGGLVSVPHHLYSIHQTYGDSRTSGLVFPPPPSSHSVSPMSQNTRQEAESRPLQDGNADVRHVDSSSLSEDDVFYN